MKFIYFAGLQSIIDGIDPATSIKFTSLNNSLNIVTYDYKKMNIPNDIFFDQFDGFIGSSFGGFFALSLGLITGKTAFGINPSLGLPKRIEMLKKQTPAQLSKFTEEYFASFAGGQKGENAHAFFNLDDDVLDVKTNIETCSDKGINTYIFPAGGHGADNFTTEMMPILLEEVNNGKK